MSGHRRVIPAESRANDLVLLVGTALPIRQMVSNWPQSPVP